MLGSISGRSSFRGLCSISRKRLGTITRWLGMCQWDKKCLPPIISMILFIGIMMKFVEGYGLWHSIQNITEDNEKPFKFSHVTKHHDQRIRKPMGNVIGCNSGVVLFSLLECNIQADNLMNFTMFVLDWG